MTAVRGLKIGLSGTGFIATYHSRSIRHLERSVPFELVRLCKVGNNIRVRSS